MQAAIRVHPAFDPKGHRQLNSLIKCERCECTKGDGYVWDDDENVIDVDHEFSICGHCDGSCWCEDRRWIGGDEYGDFNGGVEVGTCLDGRGVCAVQVPLMFYGDLK